MLNLKPVFIILFLITTVTTASAQETSPLIKGNVEISVKKGTIACDLILSNLPEIKNYVIRLNSGMNIHYFKDLQRSNSPLYYDMDTKDSVLSDETKAYYLHENTGNPARYIPKELEVKYLGMYPVIKDSTSGYMGQDWRGNIAFNGYSVRAEGIQGDWYPVLYDKDKRKRYERVRYNITVTCSDCSMLFINGSSPVRARQARFESNAPYEMSMFCGDYKAVERKGVWLLNAKMAKDDEQKLFNIAGRYQAYYEKQFKTPYKGNLSFIQTTPVAEPKDWAFSFYSSPTTFNVGAGKYGLQNLFSDADSARHKQVMAHELAHYYFGTVVKPADEFGHVIGEGFAEYLSYKLTQDLEGEQVYQALLSNKIKSLKYLRNYKPFAQVKTENDYGNREYYLYYYAPVLFMAIEKEIGRPAMWQWLNGMIASRSDHANYDFLLNSFKNSITDKALGDKIVAKYFTSDEALQNAKKELGF
ncbi:hypothetical protein A0256_17980 [Mucilaginibacter sp. PAMC 26640]|nr:hypothetical protein A0256_17980 [Mucilaginibacter sp. PAMC 26640]